MFSVPKRARKFHTSAGTQQCPGTFATAEEAALRRHEALKAPDA